jgi:hypothetical protein
MPRNLIRVVLAATLLLLIAGSAGAITWQVRMHSGRVFETRYMPLDASFDDSMIMFLSDQGNYIALPKADVIEVVTLTESLGFGRVLDDVTIMIGLLPNDKPSPEEQAELEAEAALLGRNPNYSMPLFAEPGAGGGIPLSFLNTNTPPISNSGRSGSFANQRRFSGGDGVIAEPFSRDF